MYLRLLLAMATGFAIAPGHGQTLQAGPNRVTMQSASYVDFRQVLAREPATASIAVPAALGFPVEARDKYPAVVVVHTIAGYLDANEGRYAAELREAGFATLTYDSYAARGTNWAAVSRSGPGIWPSAVADAYAALRFMASHPRIDANRIAIVGFSLGGEVAHLAALEDLRSALNPGPARFAAHVAFYPAGVFGAIAGQRAYTGSPILMLLGGKDDNLPVAKVHAYLAYASAAKHPAPIEAVTYPGAYHAWTVSSLGPLRFYPEYPSAKRCPPILLGPDRPVLLVDGQAKPFDPTAFGACMGEAPGYSMAYDAAVRARSGADALDFLRRHLSVTGR
jgi:dienelactone hydrolase